MTDHQPLPLRRMARKYALQYLYQIDLGADQLSTLSLDRFWLQAQEASDLLGEREWRKLRRQVDAIVEGILQNREELDRLIGRNLTNWTLDRLAGVDRNILRLASWELVHCADIPVAVTINEAVDLAKGFGSEDSGAFVNGVLDAIAKVACPANKAASIGDAPPTPPA